MLIVENVLFKHNFVSIVNSNFVGFSKLLNLSKTFCFSFCLRLKAEAFKLLVLLLLPQKETFGPPWAFGPSKMGRTDIWSKMRGTKVSMAKVRLPKTRRAQLWLDKVIWAETRFSLKWEGPKCQSPKWDWSKWEKPKCDWPKCEWPKWVLVWNARGQCEIAKERGA